MDLPASCLLRWSHVTLGVRIMIELVPITVGRPGPATGSTNVDVNRSANLPVAKREAELQTNYLLQSISGRRSEGDGEEGGRREEDDDDEPNVV